MNAGSTNLFLILIIYIHINFFFNQFVRESAPHTHSSGSSSVFLKQHLHNFLKVTFSTVRSYLADKYVGLNLTEYCRHASIYFLFQLSYR